VGSNPWPWSRNNITRPLDQKDILLRISFLNSFIVYNPRTPISYSNPRFKIVQIRFILLISPRTCIGLLIYVESWSFWYNILTWLLKNRVDEMMNTLRRFWDQHLRIWCFCLKLVAQETRSCNGEEVCRLNCVLITRKMPNGFWFC